MSLQAPPVSSSDMSVGDYVLLGNDILMQWYSAIRGTDPIPLEPTNVITTRQVQQTSMLLIIGAVVVAAIVLSKR